MGAEKPNSKSSHRSKPPPVPPRPQHLIPVKIMSKYSSMPDILNGWRRDTNPDLLKLGKASAYSKRGIVDVIRPDCAKMKMNGVYLPMYHAGSNEYLTKKTFMSNYRDERSKENNYTILPVRGKATAIESEKSLRKHNNNVGGINGNFNDDVNEKPLKKFSCIPSRSNSKKKSQQNPSPNNERIINGGYRRGKSDTDKNGNGQPQISRTSWYVENVELSKCEINVAGDDSAMSMTTAPNYNCRYLRSPPSKTVAVDCCTLDNSNHKNIKSQSLLPQTHLKMLSSSPCQPMMPKSLSDASLFSKTTNKTSSGYPANSLSEQSSVRSSPSRSGKNIAHLRVPPPDIPRTYSVPFDDRQNISAVYVNALSLGRKNVDDDVVSGEERLPPPPPRKPTSLDMKLSILKKEMHVLRQMDLSLLSQLSSLSESIHEFRKKQEFLSSSNSLYSNWSDEEDSGCYHSNISSRNMSTPNHYNTLGSKSSRFSFKTNRTKLQNVRPMK